MTNRRFPLRRLPDDLCSEVLKTMEHPEIIAYSFTSKKALSLVQSLRLPLRNARLGIHKWPDIFLDFGNIFVLFKFKMGKNGKEMKSLDDIPRKVYVSTKKPCQAFIESKAFNCSNPRMAVGEWVRLICSVFRCEIYDARFSSLNMRFDVQTLRNNFPKLRAVSIFGSFEAEPNDHYIQSAQIILSAFSPYVEELQLLGVPLQENLSLEHIGMANLKQLRLNGPNITKFDDILTLNVERCVILKSQFSLRDLNRFFKLWKKGSNPKLKNLVVHGKTIADWNVLMKGLDAAEEQAEADKKVYTIKNCYGIRARIKIFLINKTLEASVGPPVRLSTFEKKFKKK